MASKLKTLQDIRRQRYLGEFEFGRHAFRRAVERNISEEEIRQAGSSAELIEDYPDDKYAASCLVLRYTISRRPLHLQVSRMDTDLIKIITLYEPGPEQWDQSHRYEGQYVLLSRLWLNTSA
jgi:hypothetical protein